VDYKLGTHLLQDLEWLSTVSLVPPGYYSLSKQLEVRELVQGSYYSELSFLNGVLCGLSRKKWSSVYFWIEKSTRIHRCSCHLHGGISSVGNKWVRRHSSLSHDHLGSASPHTNYKSDLCIVLFLVWPSFHSEQKLTLNNWLDPSSITWSSVQLSRI